MSRYSYIKHPDIYHRAVAREILNPKKIIIDIVKDDVINKRREELKAILGNVQKELVKTSEIKWL